MFLTIFIYRFTRVNRTIRSTYHSQVIWYTYWMQPWLMDYTTRAWTKLIKPYLMDITIDSHYFYWWMDITIEKIKGIVNLLTIVHDNCNINIVDRLLLTIRNGLIWFISSLSSLSSWTMLEKLVILQAPCSLYQLDRRSLSDLGPHLVSWFPSGTLTDLWYPSGTILLCT